MNSATATAVRKFKTADGAYVWQPGLAAGQPATLLGYPVIEAEDMPDIAANSLSIAFGNFKAGYTIAERNATTILRDPFTNKPYVHFYATKRVGGQVVEFGSDQAAEVRLSAAGPARLRNRGPSTALCCPQPLPHVGRRRMSGCLSRRNSSTSCATISTTRRHRPFGSGRR